jgi:cystathionine beta-lyase/cystathionine gamma-synthase
VYYVKGAFLSADSAYEVLMGMRTLEMRVLAKCINTRILARFLNAHPGITVHCNDLPDNPNCKLRERQMHLGLPAPLFTIDMEKAGIPRVVFQRFFDNLAPTFDHMISLGQSNSIVSCPALTTHSELSGDALREAGILPTMIRIAVGDEFAGDLIDHFVSAARLIIDPEVPGFSARFPSGHDVDRLIEDCYVEAHRASINDLIDR